MKKFSSYRNRVLTGENDFTVTGIQHLDLFSEYTYISTEICKQKKQQSFPVETE